MMNTTIDPFAHRRFFMLDPRALARSNFGFDLANDDDHDHLFGRGGGFSNLSNFDHTRNEMLKTFFDMPLQFNHNNVDDIRRQPSATTMSARRAPVHDNVSRASEAKRMDPHRRSRVYQIPVETRSEQDRKMMMREQKRREETADRLMREEEAMMEAALKASMDEHRKEKGKEIVDDEDDADDEEDEEDQMQVGPEEMDEQLEEAIQQSLRESVLPLESEDTQDMKDEEEEEELMERAIAESLNEHKRAEERQTESDAFQSSVRASLTSEQDREYEESLAIDMEKEEEKEKEKRDQESRRKVKEIMRRKGQYLKPEPKDDLDSSAVYQVVVRLPNGKRVSRRFMKDDLVLDILDWVEFEISLEPQELDLLPSEIELVLDFPRRKLTMNLGQTLEEAGLAPRSLLVVNVL